MSMGTGVPTAPVQTPLVSVKPTVSMKPSGTGAFSAPPTQFTGAASHIKVGGALAAGAMAALFL
ncbi:hypothetical protein GQ44DRAFT_714988 [Phaeosphaeriaceae sp. PMI808]|nr:hypothetical protein GQ44DRAFT_714988 [Phaeosphaeriaceae sp. PMI808]